MKQPNATASNALMGRSQFVRSRPSLKRKTEDAIIPCVTIRQTELTNRGWNCGAAGGGHAGYSCFSSRGYPHLSIVGATRAMAAGATPATSYYTLNFNRFHYSPNAHTSYWYREFTPGRWEPEANNATDISDTAAGHLISDVLGGSLYGYGAGDLAAGGGHVAYA